MWASIPKSFNVPQVGIRMVQSLRLGRRRNKYWCRLKFKSHTQTNNMVNIYNNAVEVNTYNKQTICKTYTGMSSSPPLSCEEVKRRETQIRTQTSRGWCGIESREKKETVFIRAMLSTAIFNSGLSDVTSVQFPTRNSRPCAARV